MTLRDRMFYAGFWTSQKIARLTWRERDFFRGLIHVADDFGRFQNDVEMLRSVLYGVIRDTVSKRDVAEMMVAVHHSGLVKLYTKDGRGYGKVINFRQHGLKTRRALYPDEDGPPDEPELFGSDPEGRKEAPQPPAVPSGGNNASHSFRSQATAVAIRTRRSVTAATLQRERDALAEELRDILRPAGCAYNVQPVGEKLVRFEKLKAAHEKVTAALAQRVEVVASK